MSTLRTFAVLGLAASALATAGCYPPPRPANSQTYTDARAIPRVSELVYRAQSGWVEEEPTSSMRIAQFRLPGDGAPDATLAVFPGLGGSVQQNLTRWVGQFTQPDGRPSTEVARAGTRRVEGMAVHVLDVTGTFSASMPGAASGPLEGWRMLGAVIEARDGLVFVKATGPAATLERWSTSFDAFLDGLVP